LPQNHDAVQYALLYFLVQKSHAATHSSTAAVIPRLTARDRVKTAMSDVFFDVLLLTATGDGSYESIHRTAIADSRRPLRLTIVYR
jgi:hypothetical protein